MRSEFAPAWLLPFSSVVVIALALARLPLVAQEMTGDFQIRLMDSLGVVISGVNVTISGPSILGARGGSSDATGYVHVPGLQPGNVLVSISHSAYQPVVFEKVAIHLGRTTSLGDVRLSPRVHEFPELIVSSVRTPAIDPVSAQAGGSLRATEFQNLPVEPDYRSIISLLPEANVSYFADGLNVAGGTGMDNKFFVDGVDVAESFLNWTGTVLPYNFVSELEMHEGGYEAEYPGALGSVINVLTPSGGNEFHGSLSGFVAGNRFTPNRKAGLYDITQQGFFNYDVCLALGGPAIPEILWFYVAYNPKTEQSDVPMPGFGTAVDRSFTHSFAGKLAWKASPNIQVMLMTTGDPTTRHAVGEGWVVGGLENPDPFFVDRKTGGVNLSLRGTYAPESGFLVNATITRSTTTQDWVPATERGSTEALFMDTRTGRYVLSGGVGSSTRRVLHRDTYGIDVTLPLGPHVFKGGVQYKIAGVDDDESGTTIAEWNEASYEVWEQSVHTRVGYRIPSLFVQDHWRIADRLRLSLGMRWDSQFMIGSDGTVAQKFLNEFQPRAGFTFMLDDTQKFSASFGRFYQELSSSNSMSYTNQRSYSDLWFDHDPRVDPSGGYEVAHLQRLETTGLKGQYFDEFTFGYDRLIAEDLKFGVQCIYRALREAVGEVTLLPEYRTAFGNPGSGVLSQAPKARHEYAALVVTVQGSLSPACGILASYVLSRNYGNYEGLYDAINHAWSPNGAFLYYLQDDPGIYSGLLPNDRTHVFKLAASYCFDFGLTSGITFFWQTGTPLSDVAGSTGLTRFLSKRGTAGRTPAIWDLNGRFAYDLPSIQGLGTRLYLDILHIASQQEPVDILQTHYFDDGGQFPVPDYGHVVRYQPAMAARFGMELKF